MESFYPLKFGSIEVICGPMFSGKTEELIRRLRRAKIARQQVVVFKPSIDTRYDEVQIVSHSAQSIPSVPVDNAKSMEQHLNQLGKAVNVVGIDEAQFFDESLSPFVEKLAHNGVRVVVAGLDQDYLGVPFGPMPHLLATADNVIKQSAVCMCCGGFATKTQRVQRSDQSPQSGARVMVGAMDDYEARCRGCYVQGIAQPAKFHSEPEAVAV